MVHLILVYNFNSNILEWDSSMVPTKYPLQILENPKLSKHDTIQVILQTSEPDTLRRLLRRL